MEVSTVFPKKVLYLVFTMSTKPVRFDESSLTTLLEYVGPFERGVYVSVSGLDFHDAIEKALVDLPAEVVGNLAAPAMAIVDLATAASAGRGYDATGLITLKTGLTGDIERIYGPALFAAEDGRTTVIRIGKTILPVAQTDTTVSVGNLAGKLRLSTVTTPDGDRARVTAVLKDDTNAFEVSVLLAAESDYSADDIEDGLASGEPLATYLRPLASGGKFVKLGDLDPGMYEIAGIVESSKPEYGRFRIELVNGKVVSPNTYLKTRIDSLANAGLGVEGISQFYAGKYLWIISKDTKGNKSYVNCQITDGSDNTAPALTPAAKAPSLPAAGKDPDTMAANILTRFKQATASPAKPQVTQDQFVDVAF